MSRGTVRCLILFFIIVIFCSIGGVFARWIYSGNYINSVEADIDTDLDLFFYDIAITDISLVSKTLDWETSERNGLTGIVSSLTGQNDQTVVYKITAVNYSETTYVFTGATVVSGSLEVLTAEDASGQNRLPDASSSVHVSGTPIKPGDTFTFYATYTLSANASAAAVKVNYNFVPVIYTVIYMDNNVVYAIDCITNNTNATYSVRADYPTAEASNVRFEYWMNASGLKVTSFPIGNTNNYTLNAKWNNLYSIIFVDRDGSVVYQEHITQETTALSSNGQAVVDAKLAELQASVTEQDVSVKWADYTFGAASDIIVRPEYTYAGALRLVPVYNEGGVDDGILDYYRVEPLDTLTGEQHREIVIPGMVGVPVKIINRVTNEAGSGDWNNFNNSIETIRVGEGVERLEHNSLSYTPKLSTVYLPSTLTYMGKNTFSRNISSDFKSPTIYYNGTMAEWEALVADSDGSWDGGLDDETTIICTDGYYVANVRKFIGIITSRTWEKHSHVYGSACPSGCPGSSPF